MPDGHESRERCAAHPHIQASEHCSGCGVAMCPICTEHGTSEYCPECRPAHPEPAPAEAPAGDAWAGASVRRAEPSGFPFDRDNWALDGLMRHAAATLKRQPAELIGGSIYAFSGILCCTLGAQLAVMKLGLEPVPAALARSGALLLVAPLSGMIQLGMWTLYAKSLTGHTAELRDLIAQGKLVPAYMVHALLTWVVSAGFDIGVASWFGAALVADPSEPPGPVVTALVIANAVVMVALMAVAACATIELTINPRLGGVGSLRRAVRNLRGNYAMCLLLAWFGMVLMMASVPFCMLPFVIGGPYVGLLFAGFYMAIRKGGPRTQEPPANTNADPDA